MSATLTPTPPVSEGSQSSNPDHLVPTRRISFEESLQELPKHFTRNGDLVSSHLLSVLSSYFPDGEDFFVRSVRHYRDEITDPALRKQVAGFIGQESVHGREHRALNERLDELGYHNSVTAKLALRGLKLRWKYSRKITCLAVTAALEHFTATLAELVLTDPEARDYLGHPAVRDLLVWHTLEENEHKAVAFDVYKAVGGSERLRINIMKAVRLSFIISTTLFVTLSVLTDRKAYNPRRLWRSIRDARKSPLIQRKLWDQLREYDAKGFHPDDHDTTELTATWREELFGDEGALNNLLGPSKVAET